MKILILNGPNLNLLGIREKSIYGGQSFELYYEELQKAFPALELSYFQSNTEGVLIDKLHEVGFSYKGIVCNAGGYTHTSVALADAIKAIETPVIEVHISNVFAREAFRHRSMIAPNCVGSISGFGLESYRLALQYFERMKPKQIGFGSKNV
ncbi:type II 3-dehydroquinate dehydratase [Botryobacter ruber]|uniref:type II 3-dehydroquinate dehydratase n=1 Tax=Botryobacter ruber TaxID=2171629 RepID=UPI000E0C3078|nr:type II 3-dehydroquinate dehydratase [Botryobacter ruber]